MSKELKPVHLIMVTAQNNNKFYDMVPKGNVIEVSYGRVEGHVNKITKPISQWDKLYNSKIKKGYVDQSDLVADLVHKVEEKKDFEYKPISNKVVAEIVARLQAFANKAIATNYNVKANQVTQAMIDKAQAKLVELTNCATVDDFNKRLLELFTIIPRKMGEVKNYLASDKADFGKIIDKEQDLLDVMKGQVVQIQMEEATTEEEEYQNNSTILEAMGLEIEETTAEDVALIKKELEDCADRYYASWKLKNIKTQERFEKYCKDNNLGEKDIKLLWHGTRSENVWNILKTGLVLRPTSSIINGKLYGYGLYFAPRARKSMGYTSMGYWTRGNSTSGFMILHDVAYGTPYDVYSFDSKYHNLDYNGLQRFKKGANCLHAHAGADTGGSWGALRNDEIIVYKEDQCTCRYLVELK